MKKRILLLIIILLSTTGCTCEYNLTIDGNKYEENIILNGESSDEISEFNNKWQIPVDKDEYDVISGSDSEYTPDGDIYNYKVSNNQLTLSYDFTKSKYINSTAVSKCYKKLTVSNYNNTIIISTSPNAECFDNYPPLTSVKVNITVDREVIDNNADSISGNTYTWNITKDNASNKSINITLNNADASSGNSSSNNQMNQDDQKKSDNGYVLYIFLGMLILIIFLGYKWFMKFKEKNNSID